MKKYFYTALLTQLILSECLAQTPLTRQQTKLLVSIVVEQLCTEDLHQFEDLYTTDGFKKLLSEGVVYEQGHFNFLPVSNSSAVASIYTGSIPFYHGIIADQWIDRNTLLPVYAHIGKDRKIGASNLQTTTLGDELKVSSQGKALVYAVASNAAGAVLSAGHAANGAYWFDNIHQRWATTSYYDKSGDGWLKAYNSLHTTAKTTGSVNEKVGQLAGECVKTFALGKDNITDLLTITLSAAPNKNYSKGYNKETVYRDLDKTIATLIKNIQQQVDKKYVAFVLTGTGGNTTEYPDYNKYNIPTGTFYINRTSNLLNVYLSAIYGQARYVDAYQRNELYINKKEIEKRNINYQEILDKIQEFLIQIEGVRDVFTIKQLLDGNSLLVKRRNAFNSNCSGDIVIEVQPGWRLYNEESKEEIFFSTAEAPFPIIFYFPDVPASIIQTPVAAECIAPTLAQHIRIRAPNASVSTALPLR